MDTEPQELEAGLVSGAEPEEPFESGSSSKDYNSEDTESEEELDTDNLDQLEDISIIPDVVPQVDISQGPRQTAVAAISHVHSLDIPARVEEQSTTNVPNPPSDLCKFGPLSLSLCERFSTNF